MPALGRRQRQGRLGLPRILKTRRVPTADAAGDKPVSLLGSSQHDYRQNETAVSDWHRNGLCLGCQPTRCSSCRAR